MTGLSSLVPPLVVCAAFVAILLAVKRLAEREEAQDRLLHAAEDAAERPVVGPHVHIVAVEDEPEPGADNSSR